MSSSKNKVRKSSDSLIASNPSRNKKIRIGIMGGTFDPIHVGHLVCAEQARTSLGLRSVVFIPAGNPSFKQEECVTDAKVRLCFVQTAVASNEYFTVNALEVEREGITYTVDTLRNLKDMYSREVELVFILGADAAATLPTWHESESLAQLATFAVANRPGSELSEKVWGKLCKAGFSLECFSMPDLDISSSEIREKLKAGASVKYLVPDCVYQLPAFTEAYEHKPLRGGCYTEAFYEARKAELEQRVKRGRYKHSLGVAETAANLARLYGVPVEKAQLAGLLHDWDKGYDDLGILTRAEEVGLILSEELKAMPSILHGMTAARALAHEFPEIDDDILQAIDRHTVGAKDMSPLDMVIYIADALEPGRKGEEIEALRTLVGKVSLEELFLNVFGYWIQLILERRRPIYSPTVEIWNSYLPKQKVFRNIERPITRTDSL